MNYRPTSCHFPPRLQRTAFVWCTHIRCLESTWKVMIPVLMHVEASWILEMESWSAVQSCCIGQRETLNAFHISQHGSENEPEGGRRHVLGEGHPVGHISILPPWRRTDQRHCSSLVRPRSSFAFSTIYWVPEKHPTPIIFGSVILLWVNSLFQVFVCTILSVLQQISNRKSIKGFSNLFIVIQTLSPLLDKMELALPYHLSIHHLIIAHCPIKVIYTKN